MCPISTPRCRGRPAAPVPARARWKSARSGRRRPPRSTMLRSDEKARAAAAAVARASYGKLVAYLAARTRDVAGAEDALSEAFAAALADWPVRGVPDMPEA